MDVYYQNNKDKLLAKKKEKYRQDDDLRLKKLEYAKDYYLLNKEKINKQKKDNYQLNKEKRLLQMKAYAKANKDRLNAKRRASHAQAKLEQ